MKKRLKPDGFGPKSPGLTLPTTLDEPVIPLIGLPMEPDDEPPRMPNTRSCGPLALTRNEAGEAQGLSPNNNEMRASEVRYRRLFEAARDGILILDSETRKITDANPFMTELLGYPHSELLGKELWEIGLLKDEKASQIAFRDLQKNAFVRYDDLPLLGKTGGTHQVEFVSNLYEEGGRKVIQCNIRDITQRKSAEELIVEQAAFLDKARDAIVARDLQGKILFWNKGAERLYGWTSMEVRGRNVGRLLYANPVRYEEINKLVLVKGEWTGELHHITKSRGEITIETHWTLIKDRDGNPKSILAINTDITEKKRVEAQFMRAQRMESIGTLASGIAHDLNNILTPIMMSIDVLRAAPKHAPSSKILDTIEVSAKRGADIVRQVLSFARGLEGERIEIQPKHLLKDLEKIIKGTFPKNVRLQFLIASDAWTVLGDPTQLNQILLNLCVNARDAMPNGGDLTISIENRTLDKQYAEDEQYAATHVQAKPGPYVQICVTDSGTGIPPELINKVFEPFFTTKDIHKGTGLGLSTVMAIVKSHEGIINVYSEVGVGTTFNLYLPATVIASQECSSLIEESEMPRGKGETVLVVDDEASIVTITGETLQAFGYKVLTATNGADAVAMYAEHKKKIVLVVTDMMMPVMDGSATIHALMRINPAVKIIAASGLAANSVMAKVAGDGVKHFLTKPYTARTLLKTVRMVIDELSLSQV